MLSDPDKRARFDQYGVLDDQQARRRLFGGGAGINDLFDMFFGGAGAQGGGQRGKGEMARTCGWT